ncbi:MAG: acyl carrier protein [Gemmatimonadaceae bacterium]
MTALDERIIEIMSRTAMVPKSELAPDKKLSQLGIGSLEQIECVLSLEDELQIELNERDLHRLQTVQNVIDAVRRAYDERERARA